MTSLCVEVRNLKFGYGNRENLVLNGVSFDIHEGDFIVLAGPSGCGKSTLCDVLAGLIPHSIRGRMSGSVKIFGKDIWDWSIHSLSKYVGLVKQNAEDQLITFTVRDELAFGPENFGLSIPEIEQIVMEVAERIGIPHLLDRRVEDLSGGEKQRVVIGSILALHPKLLILDEPTAFLDTQGVEMLIQTLVRLRTSSKSPLTVLYVDHDISQVFPLATHFIAMGLTGMIFKQAPPRELLYDNHRELTEVGIRIPRFIKVLTDLPEITKLNLPLSLEELLHQPENIRTSFARAWRNRRVKPLQNGKGMTNSPLIEFTQVSYQYPRSDTKALNNISFKIYPGQFIGLVGHNGSGKTTLFYLLCKVLERFVGNVFFKGRNLREQTLKEISPEIGFIFQNPESQIFKNSIEAEICFAAQNFGVTPDLIKERFNSLTKLFGLERENPRGNPFMLSWGQKRRVNFASILIYSPDLILLDEPFIGQDQNNVKGILEILDQLHEEGKTIILCSHNAELLAEHCSYVFQLERGQIIKQGTSKEVFPELADMKLDDLAREWCSGS